jgi:hypothetical protein
MNKYAPHEQAATCTAAKPFEGAKYAKILFHI